MSELGFVWTFGVKRLLFKVHASIQRYPGLPTPAGGAQQPFATPSPVRPPTTPPSSRQGLNVLEHLLKGLPGRGLGVLEGDLDAAVEAEGFQLQPDEAEAIVVEQHEHARRPLGAGEAVASNQPCPVKTARGEEKTAVRTARITQGDHPGFG